jgi:hypothetical protein
LRSALTSCSRSGSAIASGAGGSSAARQIISLEQRHEYNAIRPCPQQTRLQSTLLVGRLSEFGSLLIALHAMNNANQPKPQSQGPLGVRFGVWLFLCSLALVGVAAIVLSRRGATTTATAPPPQESGVSRAASAMTRRAAVPAAPEPEHQGRRLSEWIEDLKTGDSKTKAAAQDAMVAIGPQVIPALAELLSDPQAANAAAFALARVGKEALPVLLDALTNGTTLARLEVAGVMSWFGPDAVEAVPALVECLRHEDAGVRGNAIASLQAIPKRPDLAVPALTVCLTDADAGVRGNAATVIGKFGHDAEQAVSNLVRLAGSDMDSHVRTRAAESLRLIAPERAEREGF